MQGSQESETALSLPQSWVGALALVVLAGVLGFGSGALMAHVAPNDKFSLVGLVVAPLWVMLELYFEAVVGVLGVRSKGMRLLSTIAVLASFYIAWFAFRP
jgi:cation transport ATPase